MGKTLKSAGAWLLTVAMLLSITVSPAWAFGSVATGEETKQYTVTYDLTNVESKEEPGTIPPEKDYTTILYPMKSYGPLTRENVSVKVGDKELNGEDYKLEAEKETGGFILTIPWKAITDDVLITATATPEATNQYTVTYVLTNVKSEKGPGTIPAEMEYTTTLTPENGYTLDKAGVGVTVGGEELTEGEEADYTFYPETGKLVIHEGKITGDVVITATATPEKPKQYTVNYDLTNVTTTGTDGQEIGEGEPYETTLTPDKGYTLDRTSVSVTVGGEPLDGEDYSFEFVPETGEFNLNIPAGIITGDVQITAKATGDEEKGKIEIDIHSENITDLQKDGDKAVSYKLGHSTVTGDPAKVVTITADNGYITPNALAPAGTGVTFAGGLDKDNNFVNTVAADGQYKSLIYTVGESDGGITAADLQAFVRDMTCVWDGNKSQTITVGADLEKPSIPYGEEGEKIELTYFNGSYYGYVPAEDQEKGITWFDAYNQAKSFTYQDAKGYLLTIESEDEHNLVRGIQNGKIGWAGGTRMVKAEDIKPENVGTEIFSTDYADTTTYGNWYWACGPNAGTKFFNGATAATGSTVDGQYSNWNTGEPNNSGSSEGYLEYGHGEGGKWNDFNAENSAVKGFYIEFTPVSETRDASDTRTTELFNVTYDLTNVTSPKNDNLIFGGDWDKPLGTDPETYEMIKEGYTTTLTPKKDYTLDRKGVSVTVGGKKLAGEDYTFDPKTGELIIPGGKITGDVVIIAKTYNGTYDWGTDVPSDVTLPEKEIYNWHDLGKPNDKYTDASTSTAPRKGVPGKWTFSGWSTKDDLTNGVESDVHFVGKWEFDQDTYKGTYDWGTDVPSDVTLPAEEIYNWHDLGTPNGKYTNASTSTAQRDGKDGTWKFSGWTPDVNLTNGVESDVHFTGKWEFTQDRDPSPTRYYTVKYDANGGTGKVTDSKSPYTKNTTVTVLGKGEIERKDYEFIVWNTKKDGTGTSYSVGDTFKITSNVTLYAQWKEDNSIFIEKHYAYIVGYKDGGVRPNGNISRAEVVTVFFRLLEDEKRTENWSKQNSYTDVKSIDWCNNAISTMTRMKVVKGDPIGTFREEDAITRAEAAAIISRFNLRANVVSAVSFNDISGHWAEADIKNAAALGWLEGDGTGEFRPDDAITRAEFVTMVNRVLARVPEYNDDMLSTMKTWPDNDDMTSWYYKAIQEATNSHDFAYKVDVVPGKGFNYEKWIQMISNRNWLALEKTDAEPSDIK